MMNLKKYFWVLALLVVGFIFGFSNFLDFVPLTVTINSRWKAASFFRQSAASPAHTMTTSGLDLSLHDSLQAESQFGRRLSPESVTGLGALLLIPRESVFKGNDSLHYLKIGSGNETELPECQETPYRLIGPQNINLSLNLSLEEVVYAYPNVQPGGHFKPFECVARQRIAVIIPFRKREIHLKIWLFYMHQFLQRQEGDYTIYVIEQHGEQQFNRAKLMNVGFTEALRNYDHNCFVFSDIDIIPMDDRNYYRCYGNPRHMANAVDKFNYRLPYIQLFGGVTAFSKDQFLKVNGFSNRFWGWGGEDDELYKRVVAVGMRVERPDSVLARSRMIPHNRDPGNESNQKNVKLLEYARVNMHTDGLNSLKYNTVNVTKHPLYTKISVDIGKPEDA